MGVPFDFLALPVELKQYSMTFIRYDDLLDLFKTSKRVRKMNFLNTFLI